MGKSLLKVVWIMAIGLMLIPGLSVFYQLLPYSLALIPTLIVVSTLLFLLYMGLVNR